MLNCPRNQTSRRLPDPHSPARHAGKWLGVGLYAVALLVLWKGELWAQSAVPFPGVTSLSNPEVKYQRAKGPYVELQRGPIRAVVVDNSAVDDRVLPGHRAGYSGLAHLSHRRRRENLFVPAYAGLNFEHIHDGTIQSRTVLFEPRHAPMQLRLIDRYTVELYQRPTPHWKLESCLRYQLLPDGAIQMTIECIPRARTFRHGYIGLFWASYIHRPESGAIHFWGLGQQAEERPGWIQALSPRHGVRATHLGVQDHRRFAHQDRFPLPLVFNRSPYRYAEPWYYGVSHGMALLFVFRPKDQVRLTQSPSGGGRGNPAWDFQYFISPYQVGKLYRMVMRAVYVPYESQRQMQALARRHLHELALLP